MRDLLRPKEAAHYLSLGLSTLARYRMSGTGPVYSKIGGKVVYRRADLDAWVNRNRRYSTASRACPETGELPSVEGI